jgi:ABC-type nitrate/sulfonate/bicarbonate transport system ATPase subunit
LDIKQRVMTDGCALSVSLSRAWVAGGDVLGPMTLNVRQGETVALSGPSGAGKSTLLRIMSGLHQGYDGTVRAPERIAMIFQEPHLLPWRSALDNLTLTSGCSRDTALYWLETVSLGRHTDKYPGQLSLGEQRRLSLARAFAATPDLLLMDEPFVSLDPKLANEMMTLSQNLISKHRITTVLVTHVEAEARRMANRHLRLIGRPARLVSD